MSHARAAVPPMSVAEFDAFLEAEPDSDLNWELVDGQILAMTNPNDDHGQLAMTLGAALRGAADAHGCRVNIGGIRVQASDDGNGLDKTIPDITVRCGARLGRNWITDPVIIVEILSPSTMDFDRGAKLEFYKSLATLTDIVIIYQDQMRVEHYRRTDDGWAMTPLTLATDELVVTRLTFAIGLSALYVGTALAQG